MSGPFLNDIWVPEIHDLQRKWYIYFTAEADPYS
jgi:GH43 family beta-xylosidase